MKLEEMQAMWKEDSKIKNTHLGSESINIPMLHSKYIDLLIDTKKLLRTQEKDLVLIRKTMTRYYNGQATKEELEVLGLEQWQYKAPLKSQLEEMLEADERVIEVQDKVEHVKLMIEFLEEVISQVKSRQYQIKNSIEWEKYINGR